MIYYIYAKKPFLIDARKFRENPALGERVVRACHETHNVPRFPEKDKKDEIK